MSESGSKLKLAVEAYLADLRRIRTSGERSYYSPLANLLNAIGDTLKPKVFCVGELAHQGAGHPDFGLYAAREVQRGRPRDGQLPQYGVVEVKPAGDDAWLTGCQRPSEPLLESLPLGACDQHPRLRAHRRGRGGQPRQA